MFHDFIADAKSQAESCKITRDKSLTGTDGGGRRLEPFTKSTKTRTNVRERIDNPHYPTGEHLNETITADLGTEEGWKSY